MYEKLPDSDPELIQDEKNPELLQDDSKDGPKRPVLSFILIILTILFVIGAYFTVKDYRVYRKNSYHKDIEVGTEPTDTIKIKGYEAIKIHEQKYRREERIISDENDLKITDCSKNDDFYVDYFTFDSLPLNIYRNTTINTRIIMKQGFQWSTEVEFELEKWFFGFSQLSFKMPCFMKFFGSCRFNFCDMLRLHWDEQFCSYIHNNYNRSCQCPDLLGPGVLEFKDWHYKPVISRVMKYFSWFAGGWYDLKIKLYRMERSIKPFLCIHVHAKVDAKK